MPRKFPAVSCCKQLDRAEFLAKSVVRRTRIRLRPALAGNLVAETGSPRSAGSLGISRCIPSQKKNGSCGSAGKNSPHSQFRQPVRRRKTMSKTILELHPEIFLADYFADKLMLASHPRCV